MLFSGSSPTDCPVINVPSITTLSMRVVLGFSMASIRRLAASLPISSVSWRIVVILGWDNWEILVPSYPATVSYTHLVTFTLYAAVCIRAERFLLYRKTIPCKVKKIPYCPFLSVMTIANLLLKSCYSNIYFTVLYHPAINFLLPLPAMQKYPSDYFLFQFLICS